MSGPLDCPRGALVVRGERIVDRYASDRLQRGCFPAAFEPTTVLRRGSQGMVRVGWSQALLECPSWAQVRLCRAQKTDTLVTGRFWGLAVSHSNTGGRSWGMLSTSPTPRVELLNGLEAPWSPCMGRDPGGHCSPTSPAVLWSWGPESKSLCTKNGPNQFSLL